MNCILIFDNLNDVLFAKYNREFSSHLQKLGSLQGLTTTIEHDDTFPDGSLNTNMLIQLFSPVVTSQRIMSTQFGNSYTSVQCLSGTNIVFDEYMGFLFVCVGSDPVVSLQHRLCVFISLSKHVCGPDISELKCNARSRSLLGRLFDSWNDLRANDQACLVEAVEQLTVNPDVTTAAIKTLQSACNSLRSTQSAFDCSKSHALIFVENKLLALYSSREAEDLSPSDILFLNILSSIYRRNKGHSDYVGCTPDISPNIPDVSINSPDSATPSSDDRECINKMNSEVVLLKGKKVLMPHAVHMANFGNGVTFMLLHQICHEAICIGFDEVFSCLALFNKLVGSDTEVESQKKVFESLEIGMKKVIDCLKKVKNKQDIEPVSRQLQSKWDVIKKKYHECVKNNEDVGITLSAGTANLLITLRQIFQGICLLSVLELPINYELILKILQQAQQSLLDFNDFLKAKVHHNFTLNSRSLLTINKYLEEFPGLVHFMYIDRTNHRVTAPFLNFSFDETNVLALRKIWEMVDLSRNHIREGQLAFVWKDTTFSYAYFLWFEDQTGTPLKPKISPGNVVRSLPMPGILAGDFYKCLVSECFPKMSGKVRCFELYCIHLGLANSSIVLDQSRRIAATVGEVSGQGSTDRNFSC